MSEVNDGHASAYGDDTVTAQLGEMATTVFGPSARIFPVFNGTGANVVALQSMCRSWEAVICARSAHINADEGGAPEKVAGLKLHTIPTSNGKLTPESASNEAFDFGSVHRAQQKVISITNTTELGTVYTPGEIAALADFAHSHGMYLHLDGARLSNAAASLGATLREITTDCGVDAVSLGATKNGALAAEAVVTLNPDLADAVPFVRKSAMQLTSKMRFTSAQLLAMFGTDLYLRNANHANAMADRLYDAISGIDGIDAGQRPAANALFPILPREVTERLQQSFRFYMWNHLTGQVRWMCSWDTTESDVDTFAAAIAKEMS